MSLFQDPFAAPAPTKLGRAFPSPSAATTRMDQDEPVSPLQRAPVWSSDPDDPFAAPSSSNDTHRTPPSSYSRPRTNRPKNADRITRQNVDDFFAQSATFRDESNNPFLERATEVFSGKKLAPKDNITDYVFRGKRISLDQSPFATLDSDEDGNVEGLAPSCTPRLLFPTPPATLRKEHLSPIKRSAFESPTRRGLPPPTPESLRRPAGKRMKLDNGRAAPTAFAMQ